MGRVLVTAKLESLKDLWLVEQGLLKSGEIHRLDDVEALVDTGSTYLSMPRSKLKELGFKKPYGTARMRTGTGVAKLKLYGPVRLTVQDRYCRVGVAEIAEGTPILRGQVPLELMDFVVDPRQRKLIGNPEHGGEWIVDMFLSAKHPMAQE